MGIAVLTFIAVFVLIASAGVLLFYRAAMLKRLSTVVSGEANENVLARVAAAGTGASFGAIVEPFHKVLPRSTEEVSVVQKRLIRAGYRKDVHVNFFYAAKVLVPVIMSVLATATGLYEYG